VYTDRNNKPSLPPFQIDSFAVASDLLHKCNFLTNEKYNQNKCASWIFICVMKITGNSFSRNACKLIFYSNLMMVHPLFIQAVKTGFYRGIKKRECTLF